MVFDGKKERERSREGARAWLGSGEAHAEENKTVPAHVMYMGRFSPLESAYSTA